MLLASEKKFLRPLPMKSPSWLSTTSSDRGDVGLVGSNVATHSFGPFTCTVVVSGPVQLPAHPVNTLPATGIAVNVTRSADAKTRSHVCPAAPQSIPPPATWPAGATTVRR